MPLILKKSHPSKGASRVPMTSPHMGGLWWLVSMLQYKK